MPHPIIEAIYIGLITSGVAQPVALQQEPEVTAPAVSYEWQVGSRERVVYDWNSGSRTVYRQVPVVEQPTGSMIGISEEQVERLSPAAKG